MHCPTVHHRLGIHRIAVALNQSIAWLDLELDRFLHPFEIPIWPQDISPIHGDVRPYDLAELSLRLPSNSSIVPGTDDLIELYQNDASY